MTPYRYFKDKEDILAAVRARAFNRFAEALEGALAQVGQNDDAIYGAYVSFAFGEPAAYKLMFDLTQPDESHYPDLVRANARARATMTEYVKLMIDAGKFVGDAELIGHVFWAVLHGTIVLKLAGKLTPEYDFKRISDEASRVVSDAYRPKRA